jgi:hypothetical protein
MRSGVLPSALLFAALGLALAFAPRSIRRPSFLALLAGIGTSSVVPIPGTWTEGVFFGCWISVIATAVSVHLVRGVSRFGAVALALNAGIWAGAVGSLSAARLSVLLSLPCVLIVIVASWLVDRRNSVAVKVVSSWIIAVAALAATLQLLPVTPGYLPDHME